MGGAVGVGVAVGFIFTVAVNNVENIPVVGARDGLNGANDGEVGAGDGAVVFALELLGNGRAIFDPLEKDTAAIARPRPTIVDDEPYVIDTLARMVPTKLLEYPMVALEPTAQYTFVAMAPF